MTLVAEVQLLVRIVSPKPTSKVPTKNLSSESPMCILEAQHVYTAVITCLHVAPA